MKGFIRCSPSIIITGSEREMQRTPRTPVSAGPLFHMNRLIISRAFVRSIFKQYAIRATNPFVRVPMRVELSLTSKRLALRNQEKSYRKRHDNIA